MLSLYHHYIIIYDQVDESTIILTGGTPEGMRAETGVFEYSGLGQSYEVWLINTESTSEIKCRVMSVSPGLWCNNEGTAFSHPSQICSRLWTIFDG